MFLPQKTECAYRMSRSLRHVAETISALLTLSHLFPPLSQLISSPFISPLLFFAHFSSSHLSSFDLFLHLSSSHICSSPFSYSISALLISAYLICSFISDHPFLSFLSSSHLFYKLFLAHSSNLNTSQL